MKRTAEELKKMRQRQVLINEAIELGAFDDRNHFKAWMKDEFKLKQPLSEVSTEYSLNEKQMKLLFVWLKHFTGRGPKPRSHRARAKVTNAQLYHIEELQTKLGWDAGTLARFTERQIGKKKLTQSLFKHEATKLITGMERIIAEQPFKSKENYE